MARTVPSPAGEGGAKPAAHATSSRPDKGTSFSRGSSLALSPARMLKTRNIGAYRDLLVLFTRYGRKDFRLSLDPDELLMSSAPEEAVEMEPDVRQRAEAFATALKNMGPTYVKFGQVLSTRPDVVPPEYINALESLQDNVEPFSFADVEKTVEEELGVRISKAFASFDSTPLAAASLGQVHRAQLRDGREVVVKVQRPNVREQVRHDLEVFVEIATTLEEHTDLGRKMNLVGAIEQAKLSLFNELNYLQEARNTEILRENLKTFPQIYIPTVVHDLSSSRVLTTELVKGQKVSKLTPISLIERDYAELAGVLTRAYLRQICVDGVWHSDPHPGNVFIRDDENAQPQIVLLDFGMVSRISHEFQDEIIKLMLAISSNRGTEVADACVRLSEVQERFEPTKFIREISTLVANFHDVDVNQINVGQLLFNVISIANNNELKAPPELAMLAKTLLHLDGLTKKLDPNYDPQRVIRDYSEQLMTDKLQQKFNPRNFYPALLDLNQLVLDLPHRTREILDLTAASRLTFGIKVTQAEEFLGGMHKIANRITVGVVIAALLIASALMMRVPSRFAILGYPGLAVIGYLIAVIAAVFLIVSTILRDRKDQERAKMKAK
jgi:ubiquinone biosynthesis protein